MTGALTRRQFLRLTAAVTGGLMLHRTFGSSQELSDAVGQVAAVMTEAARHFLDSLGANRSAALFPFASEERFDWHWNSGHVRDGVTLGQLNDEQRRALLALVAAGTSQAGYQKAVDIMFLQLPLGNDPERYTMAIFGEPSLSEPWGWRFEGHHLSLNYTILGSQVAITPLFLGAWPTLVASGDRQGLQVMGVEEETARSLLHSLGDDALFDRAALGTHVTGRAKQVAPLETVGLLRADFNAEQRTMMDAVLMEYLGVMPAAVADVHRQRLETAGQGNISFGWAGGTEPLQPHYYRMQGPSFLLEFDNSRNGATHIHSVWRDFEQDFGLNWL